MPSNDFAGLPYDQQPTTAAEGWRVRRAAVEGSTSAHPGEITNVPHEHTAEYWRSMYEDQLRRKRLLHQRFDQLHRDFAKLGTAIARLYLEAINGVVCDPHGDGPFSRVGRPPCHACSTAWAAAREVLTEHDPDWGNLYRGGPAFQPKSKAEQKRADA